MQFSKEDNNRLPSGNPPYILRENGDVLDEVQGGVKDDFSSCKNNGVIH